MFCISARGPTRARRVTPARCFAVLPFPAVFGFAISIPSVQFNGKKYAARHEHQPKGSILSGVQGHSSAGGSNPAVTRKVTSVKNRKQNVFAKKVLPLSCTRRRSKRLTLASMVSTPPFFYEVRHFGSLRHVCSSDKGYGRGGEYVRQKLNWRKKNTAIRRMNNPT